MREKVPVFKTVAASVKGVVAARGELSRAAAAPLFLSVSLSVLGEALFEPHELLLLGGQVYSLVSALPLAYFAFTCHRSCLRHLGVLRSGPEAPRIVTFVLWTLASFVVLALPQLLVPPPSPESAASDGPATLLNAGATIAAWFVIVRCSLVLPATAAGEPAGLGAAWALSSGSAWRLFWTPGLASLLYVLPVLIALLSAGLLLVPGALAPEPLTPTRFAVNAALDLAGYLAAATAAFSLCLMYAHLRGDTPAA